MKSAYETLLSNYEIGGLMTGWVIDLGGFLTEGVKDRVVSDRGGLCPRFNKFSLSKVHEQHCR